MRRHTNKLRGPGIPLQSRSLCTRARLPHDHAHDMSDGEDDAVSFDNDYEWDDDDGMDEADMERKAVC